MIGNASQFARAFRSHLIPLAVVLFAHEAWTLDFARKEDPSTNQSDAMLIWPDNQTSNQSQTEGGSNEMWSLPSEQAAAIKNLRAGHIAVIVRGQSFRTHLRGHNGPACDPTAVEDQNKATDSLMKYVVNPFREHNVTIDLVVTDAPCNLSNHFGARIPNDVTNHRVEGIVVGTDQTDSFHKTLDFFQRYMDFNRISVRSYDLIIITRHDLVWKKSLLESTIVNISKMNFAAPCEKGQSDNCIIDVLHMMPGYLYPTFIKANCFLHMCHDRMRKMMAKVGAKTGFVLWDQPANTVRGLNDWYYLYNR